MSVLINRLATSDADFESRVSALLDRAPESSLDVTARTAEIVEAIRSRGAAALVEYTNRFDRRSVSHAVELELPKSALEAAWHSLPAATVAATISTAREIDGQTGQVTVTRSGDTTLPLLVPLAVSGTAVSGTHFQALPASITIPAGQTSAAVSVTPLADSLAQGNRTVVVAVAADFALVRDAAQTATVTIQDKPFDAWRFANFTSPELANPSISGETADPDADQLANLLEYALGLAPKSPGISPVAAIDLNGYLALTVTKNPAASEQRPG